MGKWKYFTDDEVIGLQDPMVAKLDLARCYAGFPIVLTSLSRTPEHNAAVGGTPDSSHLKGIAVDIRRPIGEFEVLKLVWALGLAGFRRVLIYTKHIHADMDETKPQPICVWMGESH